MRRRRAMRWAAAIGVGVACFTAGMTGVMAQRDTTFQAVTGLGVAVGYERYVYQPGATLLGDRVVELESPMARVELQVFGSAGLASMAYPGDLVAESPGLLRGGGAPVPDYPVEARAVFPPSGEVPSDEAQAGSDIHGARSATMEAHAAAQTVRADASAAEVAPGSSVDDDAAPVVAESLVTHSDSVLGDGGLTTRATSSGRGLRIAGGVVRIAQYESKVEATSDGTTGVGKASTTTTGVTVSGVAAVLDHEGLHAAGIDVPPASRALLDGAIQRSLADAGVEIRLAEASGGADPNAPSTGVASTGGLLIIVNGPERVTEVFSLGAASALARLTQGESASDVLGFGPAGTDLGGTQNVEGAGSPTALLGAGSLGTGSSTLPRAAIPGLALASRRDRPAGHIALALLGSVALFSGLLGYARWQLLDWLPENQGG